MKMKFIIVTVQGITPLLMNAFVGDPDSNGSSKASASKDYGTPRQQATKKLYIGTDGETLVMPQPNIFKCIIEGGKFFKNGKSKVTTMKTSLIPACAFLPDIEYELEYSDGDGWYIATKDESCWSVDTRPIVNPSTGGRILRHRPILHDWRFTFNVSLDTEEMSVNLFRDIVDAAGSKIGLGDFRPACKGSFGRWKVVNWEVNDEETESPEAEDEEEFLEV